VAGSATEETDRDCWEPQLVTTKNVATIATATRRTGNGVLCMSGSSFVSIAGRCAKADETVVKAPLTFLSFGPE
jgi:hypothetical protein